MKCERCSFVKSNCLLALNDNSVHVLAYEVSGRALHRHTVSYMRSNEGIAGKSTRSVIQGSAKASDHL